MFVSCLYHVSSCVSTSWCFDRNGTRSKGMTDRVWVTTAARTWTSVSAYASVTLHYYIIDLQMAVDKIVDVSSSMGMCINVAKTEIQFLGKGNITFQIKVNGQQLQQTENFVYLGGNISTNDGSGEGHRTVDRIGSEACYKRWTEYGHPKNSFKQTKMRVYETLVKSVLLYNSETWTLKEMMDKSRLRVFEMTCLRKIEGMTRRDR